MTDEKKENIVTSDQVAPQKKTPKKSVKKEEDVKPVIKEGKVIIYFESGFSYTTPSGFTFSKEHNRMAEMDVEEANNLLRLPNFRLPSDEEKEFYYNNLEA